MKRFFAIAFLAITLITFSFGIANVSAQATTPKPGLDNVNYKIPCPTVFCSLEDIINLATNLIRPAFIVTFLAMLLYGAWLWLTSGGDDKKIKKARLVMVAAIIGFSLGVLAPVIVQVVGGFLGINNAFTLN